MKRLSTVGMLGFLGALAAGGVLLGCAVADEGSGPADTTPPPEDTGVVTDDTGADTGTDASTDAIPDGGSCRPAATQSRPCGKCGTQTRTCNSSGAWGSYAACSGEDDAAECSIGETRDDDCEKCGKQKSTCNPTTCTFDVGVCAGGGECDADVIETTTASCSKAGEIRSRTCSATCKWSKFTDCLLPKGFVKGADVPTGIVPRYDHTATWTGTEMVMWGGVGGVSFSTAVLKDGAIYDPAGNAWRTLDAAPTAFSARTRHTALWSGKEVILWGGSDSTSTFSFGGKTDGATYNPTTKTWKVIANAPIVGRAGATAVWSTVTNQMIVWGGQTSTSGTSICTGGACSDGAAYDPTTDIWTVLPAPPPGFAGRYGHTMVWTGTEVVIWGGQSSSSTYLRDGARFDPKSKIWIKFAEPPTEIDGRYSHVGVFTGKDMVIFGGYGTYVASAYGRGNGARYTPGGGWNLITPPADGDFGSSSKRYGVNYVWTGTDIFMFSGGTTSSKADAGAAFYNPATDKWRTVELTDAPAARSKASVIWTGREAVIFGGSSYASYASSPYFNDVYIYRP